jgi:hypothetical protein
MATYRLILSSNLERVLSESRESPLEPNSESDSGSTDSATVEDPWVNWYRAGNSIESATTQPTVSSSINNPPVTQIKTEDLLKERSGRYGKFTDQAFVTQALFGFVMDELERRYKQLQSDQKEALHMIFSKIGRIVNGDPDYSDSWHDIAGYAKLVADRLDGVSQ